MATARTPRQSWVDAGLSELAENGPEAVRVESLARDLGVSKGGFYGHFADRNALLAEMLDAWEARCVTDVIELVEREGGDPLSKARKAASLTFATEIIPIDLAVRVWSRRDPAVAERLRRVDNQRMDYLRSSFAPAFPDKDDLEARCLLAFSAALGRVLIAADHPGHTRLEVIDLAAKVLFSEGE